jgi:hypothetical protein
VFLINASLQQPLEPFDSNDDRSLIVDGCIKKSTQQRDVGHPPQQTQLAVRVHVVLTLQMFALATA